MARNKSPSPDPERGEATARSEGNQIVVDDELRDYIRSIDGSDVGKVAVLSFRALQLYRIAALQRELVGVQNDVMQGRKKTGDDIDSLLQKYGK
jgi:hypothetical protein